MKKRAKSKRKRKTSRIKMVMADRGVGHLVYDRFLRFRYKGVIYTSVQHGVDDKTPVRIKSGLHCYPDLHLDPKEQKYLRSRGIRECDWKMTNKRVPEKVLREIDENTRKKSRRKRRRR